MTFHSWLRGFVVPTILGTVAFGSAQESKMPDQFVYLRCGTLIDGNTGQARTNVTIVVKNDRVSEIKAGNYATGSAGTVIDLSRETCLPGLIDTHTHILLQGDVTAADYDEQLLKQSTEYRAILATVNVRRALEYGFTTLRDVETEGAGYADVDVKKAVNNGVIPGPRMQVATRALDVTGAYPLLGYAPNVPVPHGVQVVDGADEARKAVREQISHGADWIKVYSEGIQSKRRRRSGRHSDLHSRRTQSDRGGSASGTAQGRVPRHRSARRAQFGRSGRRHDRTWRLHRG